MRLLAHTDWNPESQEKVTGLIDGIMDSIRQVIPVPATFGHAAVLEGAAVQSEIGVLVGFTGDSYGRIVIQGSGEAFGGLGGAMFGMPLEGELLHSFIGELANMIAGNTSTQLFNKGRKIDITPPTVMVGKLQIYGFEQGITLPVALADIGELSIVLTIQTQGAA